MSSKNSNTTPMIEQYFRIKNEYRDSLLFFRLGDFYEMFYEDAKKASPVLEIALTSRQKVPMCGVPHHSVDVYLAKLLRHGFKVAICEQVEDPKKAKGVVKREVVKVLTPGTAIELEKEEEKEGTFVASLCLDDEMWGLALIDLASGRINASQNTKESPIDLTDELFKIAPKEVIFPANQEQRVAHLLGKDTVPALLQCPQEEWIFDFQQAKTVLLDHFQVKSLKGFGLSEETYAVSAAGALLHYLKKLRKDSLSLIHGVSFVQTGEHVVLDAASIKNLELVRNLRDGKRANSLLDVIDFTVTSMGGRLLKSWILQPLRDCSEIGKRLDCVEEFIHKTIERSELREALKGIVDLERLTGKISLAVANARDLVSLKNSLKSLPSMKIALEAFSSPKIEEICSVWDNAEDLAQMVEEAVLEDPAFLLTEGGIIKEGYNSELDELKKISRSGKSVISRIEKRERDRTGIASLKIRYNKVFGYYIDVTKPNLSLVPSDYIRKQTLVNSERFITPELKEYEDKIMNAEQRIGELEYTLFLEIREAIAGETVRLQRIAARVAVLDVLSSLAELASSRNYLRPVVDSGDRIKIAGGRHPVVEVTNTEPFIPNDTYMDRKTDQIVIVTGPNMGGKSTYLRQTALICILAQIGSFVPAEECEIGVLDRIFTRIGAMDFLSVGQSTFMVEMLEAANILNNATSESLILLDEIGRGTSTFDGLSIAWAIAEYLHEREEARAKTLFATHYHELTELELTMERIKNYHVSVKEWKGDITFLRKIVSGPSDQSYGIHVAKLAGIPRMVIERAREILFNLEKKELDASGLPRIAYHPSRRKNKAQMLLFEEDRERVKIEEIIEEIERHDLDRTTPIEALALLTEVKKKISSRRRKD